MATIKLKFKPSSVAHAKGSLIFQLTHKGSVRRLQSGHHVFAEEWSEDEERLRICGTGRRRRELRQIQAAVDLSLERWRRIVAGMDALPGGYTADALAAAFPEADRPGTTVFAFLQEQMTRKEMMNRLGTSRTYANAFRRFREFRCGRDLDFPELTPELIERYEAWLIGRGLKQNTIRFYLRTLHTLLKRAVEEGLAVHRRLFGRIRLSFVTTAKRAIAEADVSAIERLPLPQGTTLSLARDIFMFSFYTRGMPFVDIAFLRKSDLRNGMLSYCRKKTGQQLTLSWEKEQQAIIGRYARQTRDSPYMFPIIVRNDGTEYHQYQRKLENINRSLKKIGEMIGLKIPLTTYVARHTWASIAQSMNYSVAIISQGMGHHSYRTTQVYLDSIDTSKINEANKKIIRRIRRKGS